MNLREECNGVSEQEELVDFINKLIKSYMDAPSEWTNKDIPSFLEALSAWIEDMEGYYKNQDLKFDKDDISWGNIADMLYAATMYE